ncbi:MAG: MoaD family protein [Dethiobacteria bacterium]
MATVKLYASLREIAGEKEFSTGATTIKAMLKQAEERYGPEFAEKLKVTTVLVNGNNITHLQWKNTRLQDGDVVSLFPPLGGG